MIHIYIRYIHCIYMYIVSCLMSDQWQNKVYFARTNCGAYILVTISSSVTVCACVHVCIHKFSFIVLSYIYMYIYTCTYFSSLSIPQSPAPCATMFVRRGWRWAVTWHWDPVKRWADKPICICIYNSEKGNCVGVVWMVPPMVTCGMLWWNVVFGSLSGIITCGMLW